MIKIIIAIAILMVIVLGKKIPKIGGDVMWALYIGAVAVFLMFGAFNPLEWIASWGDGINRLSWVIWIALAGAIYAESQKTSGAIDTVLDASRAAFAKSCKSLYVVSFVCLVLFGALLGEGLSVGCSVGLLLIPPLVDIGLKPTEVSATLVLGSLIGSLCPPLTNGLVLAAGLSNADYDTVLRWSFISVPLVAAIVIIYYTFRFVKQKELPQNLRPKEKAGQILSERWVTLVPTLVLVLSMILRYGPWKNVVDLDFVKLVFTPLIKVANGRPFIGGLTNLVFLSLLFCTIVTFITSKETRKRGVGEVCVQGMKNVWSCLRVLIASGLFLGAIYHCGLVDIIGEWASTLNGSVLKIGGSLCFGFLGSITGSQSTCQSIIMPFFAPALQALGMTPEATALAGAHLAMGAQAFPPTDLCTIVIAPLVAMTTGKDCDYMKSMLTSLPGQAFLWLSGLVILFLFPVLGL